jgi:hypothetical protein
MKENEFIEINIEVGQLKTVVNQLYTEGKIKKASNGKIYVNIQIAKTKERNYEKSLSASVYDSVTKTKKYIGNGNMKAWENGTVVEINLHETPAPTAITPTVSTTYPTAKATNNMQAVAQDVLFDVPVQKDTEDDLPF